MEELLPERPEETANHFGRFPFSEGCNTKEDSGDDNEIYCRPKDNLAICIQREVNLGGNRMISNKTRSIPQRL